MAESGDYDEGAQVDAERTPDELVEQAKLRLELMKLREAKEVLAPSPAEIDAKKAEGVEKLKAVMASNAQKAATEKPVETQTPPAEIDPEPVTMDKDTPAFPAPDYTPKREPNVKMLSTIGKPGKTFSPEVEEAIDSSMHLYPNLTREQVGAIITVESSGDPRSNKGKGTQYKGLMNIGTRDSPTWPSEWTKYGEGKDVYDAAANLAGGAKIMARNRQIYINKFGKEPPIADLYLMHQQGPGFFLNGTMTNISGNLPKDAQRPENMTWAGFRDWWTRRIDRAMKERGSTPTMRVTEDSNLPPGFLTPTAFANIGGKELTTGGLAETPEEQAMIAELMQGKPLSQMPGTEQAVTEAAIRARKGQTNYQPQTNRRVPLSQERTQVSGILPQDPSVSHTEPLLPMPGMMPDELTQTYLDITNPSLRSTINNYQELRAPPPVEVKQPEATPAGQPPKQNFLQALISTMNRLSPINWTKEGLQTAADVAPEAIEGMIMSPGKGVAQVGQGLLSGVQDLPVAMTAGGVVPAAATAGLLTGSQSLQQFAAQTASDANQWKIDSQKRVGIDPENPTGAQWLGHQVGSNLGMGMAKTAVNTVMSTAMEQVLGPATAYMAKNFPIPELGLTSTAHADAKPNAFGNVPIVVQTPSGPLVMNSADIQQFAWGGLFAVGFGASFPVASKTVHAIRHFKPLGLDAVFDPRRAIPGAEGTEAASLPIDKLKAGIIDQGKAMIDIAMRQFNYEKGVSTGFDPIAANEVLQAWRVQTNSGAQNLVRQALTTGEMNVPEFRFKVNTSIQKLTEFAKINPDFPEYLRIRAIADEINYNSTVNSQLPTASTAQRPVVFKDHNGIKFEKGTNGPGDIDVVIAHYEGNNSGFKQAYDAYRDNLEATRDLITSHPTNNIENYVKLTDKAIERPTLPIFSAEAKTKDLFDDFLAGKNPLELAEHNMRKAFEKQMKFDAEQKYIDMTAQNVGSKAFTERDAAWVESQGAKAKDIGALLTRQRDGQTVYYTADPLLVSIMNSGQIPLSAMEQTFASFRTGFQKTTTGAFAPWFATTGMIRSMEQGWTTAPAGMKDASGRSILPAGPWSTLTGIAERTGAQIAKPTAVFFKDTVANSALGKTLTFGQADLIGRSFEKWYMDSFYRRMEVAGAFSGDSIMEGKEVFKSISNAKRMYGSNPTMNPVVEYMQNATDNVKRFTWNPAKNAFYTPLNEFLNIVQEGPAYGWARKVGKGADDVNRPTQHGRPLSDAELAAQMRNYTGDPSTRGYIYEKGGTPIRFMSEGGLPNRPLNAGQKQDQHLLRSTWGPQDKAYEMLAKGAHWGRSVTPWAGVLFQSPSATLAALRDNPIRANAAFATSHILPEMTAYFWNAYHSEKEYPVLDEKGEPVLDPTGAPMTQKFDYVNHMINMRNSHNLLNNTYFAVPGKAPHEGVEFRHYQEGALNRYMTRMFMHQYYGKATGDMYEDIGKALNGFLATAVIPPLPSPVGAFLGTKGYVTTGGWAGSLFKSRNNPYVDLGGGESWLELTARAIAPSLADITIQAMTAGMGTPKESPWTEKVTNAAKQVGTRALSRTALIGDAFGVKPDVTGTTNLSDELWTNKKVIDDLAYRYRVWDSGKGEIKTNKGSGEGRAHIAPHVPELPPSMAKNTLGNPGMQQAKPTNPLYELMMSEVEKTFIKDEPKKGGVGFKSLWGQYGIWGQLANRMRTVHGGNDGPWIAEQLSKPDDLQWYREHGVNPLNHKEMKDFYNTQRNSVTQTILQTIKATEQRMNENPQVKELMKGKEFKIWMLDPDDPKLKEERAEEIELQSSSQ